MRRTTFPIHEFEEWPAARWRLDRRRRLRGAHRLAVRHVIPFQGTHESGLAVGRVPNTDVWKLDRRQCLEEHIDWHAEISDNANNQGVLGADP